MSHTMSVFGLCLSRRGLAAGGIHRLALAPARSTTAETSSSALPTWTRFGNQHSLNSNQNHHSRCLSSSAVSQVRRRHDYKPQYISRIDSSHSSTATSSSSVLESRLQSEHDVLDRRSLDEQEQADKEVMEKISDQITSGSYGRLFAVVYINQKQFKVTAGDVVMLEDYDIGAPVGTKIAFDKIVLVGGRDFTLIGRPVLPRDLAQVTATVVEKNISKTNVHLVKYKKLQEARTYFSRWKQTTFRINSVDLLCPPEDAKDRLGFETRDDDPAFL